MVAYRGTFILVPMHKKEEKSVYLVPEVLLLLRSYFMIKPSLYALQLAPAI